MSTLTNTFSEKADRETPAKSVLAASLMLVGADTRRGMSAETKAAFDVVKAHSAGVATREDYLNKFAASAGAPAAAAPRAKGLKL